MYLPGPKAGVCVSTVSIVCARDGHVAQASKFLSIPANRVYQGRRRQRGRSLCYPSPVVSDAADGADGFDGIFERRTYPDDPASGSAFATERNVDAPVPAGRFARDAGGQRASADFLASR
jgi:hypothetical protein